MRDIVERIRGSPVVHADETGWREDGNNGYVWTFSTPTERYFLRRGRGKAVVDEALGDEFAGVLVSDFYAAYHHYDGPKQRCWAHTLRDIHDMRVLYPDDHRLSQWADAIHQLYQKAKAFTHPSEEQRRTAELTLERRLLALCRPYLDDPSAAQATLCRRMENHIKELFVFVAHPEVPPDNNAAERSQLRTEVRAILKERGATVVCVTHDQEEAMQLADRVAVMNKGHIEQLGAPEQVFNYPDTRYSAEFFGIAHFLPAWLDGERLASEVGWVPWRGPAPAPSAVDGEIQIMVRPYCVDIEPTEEGNGLVAQRDFLGAFNMYTVDLDSVRRVQVMQSHISRFEPGTRVRVSLREGHSPQRFINGRAIGGTSAHNAP